MSWFWPHHPRPLSQTSGNKQVRNVSRDRRCSGIVVEDLGPPIPELVHALVSWVLKLMYMGHREHELIMIGSSQPRSRLGFLFRIQNPPSFPSLEFVCHIARSIPGAIDAFIQGVRHGHSCQGDPSMLGGLGRRRQGPATVNSWPGQDDDLLQLVDGNAVGTLIPHFSVRMDLMKVFEGSQKKPLLSSTSFNFLAVSLSSVSKSSN